MVMTSTRGIRDARRSAVARGRAYSLVVLCVVALMVTSCSSPTGHVSGVIQQMGGVAPAPGGLTPGAGRVPTRPLQGVVTANPVDGTGQGYGTRTAVDGTFSFDLPPGTYTVTATVLGGDGPTLEPKLVIVRAGETSGVVFSAYVP